MSELSIIHRYGAEVLGSMEEYRRWLETPCPWLEGVKPVDLLNDSDGMEMVIRTLFKIEHNLLPNISF